MRVATVSQSMEDSTIVVADLSAECSVRFKCATLDIADRLVKDLQSDAIDLSVNIEFPGNQI